MRILLVEDDPGLVTAVRRGLGTYGLDVVSARTAGEGFDQALVAAWSAIVLDVNLPDEDGVTACRRIRRAGVATPILMVSAHDAVEDCVTGLEAGADDYLVKPFALRELNARLWALARRPPAIADTVVRVADLAINLRTHSVERAGRQIELTAKEFALLEFLARNVDVVVDRAAITAYVWDDNHDPFSNAIEVLVSRLRARIDDGHEPRLIHTLRGAGYRFGP
jgi:DNA-binding response OmpR family regulator